MMGESLSQNGRGGKIMKRPKKWARTASRHSLHSRRTAFAPLGATRRPPQFEILVTSFIQKLTSHKHMTFLSPNPPPPPSIMPSAAAAVVRRSLGFQRYAFSVQYHGSSFLGFTSQGDQEDCIVNGGQTDLRGFQSVESRLATALDDLVGPDQWENMQVSSRTDRGVHALKNTCHVDICLPANVIHPAKRMERIHRGLNFYLRRQLPWFEREERPRESTKQYAKIQHTRLGNRWLRYDPMNELRVLQVKLAPHSMTNAFANTHDPTQPAEIDWNARFSATQRTYLYRILYSEGPDADWAAPFEWDRSWRIHSKSLAASRTTKQLNVETMRQAAQHLVGEHDFTSFRGKGCVRSSAIVTLEDIQVHAQPRDLLSFATNSTPNRDDHLHAIPNQRNDDDNDHHFIPGQSCQMIHLVFKGNAFLYRQVRNLTGCLVQVGRGRLEPLHVRDILAAQDRSKAPAMAPPHGLFLVDVQHGNFRL